MRTVDRPGGVIACANRGVASSGRAMESFRCGVKGRGLSVQTSGSQL